jgi:hypothetical protein
MRGSSLTWLLGASLVLAAPQPVADVCAPVTVTSTVYVSKTVAGASTLSKTMTSTKATSPAAVSNAASVPTNNKATSGYRNIIYLTNW